MSYRGDDSEMWGLIIDWDNFSISDGEEEDKYREAVELKRVKIGVKQMDFSSQVTLWYEYCNNLDKPLQVKYVQPKPHTGAIVYFCATLSGRKVKGKVQEVEQAQRA